RRRKAQEEALSAAPGDAAARSVRLRAGKKPRALSPTRSRRCRSAQAGSRGGCTPSSSSSPWSMPSPAEQIGGTPTACRSPAAEPRLRSGSWIGRQGGVPAPGCRSHGTRMTTAPGTILIIDDEPPIRRFLRTTLAAQDYRVVEAATGGEGLSLLRHEKPDLVVVDLGLPDMDGLDLIRRIPDSSRLPIVVLSSRDDEKGKVAALDLGADDYVTKPFGVEELMARLRAALRHRVQEQGGRPVFQNGDLTVDLVRRIVTARGEEVKL